MMLKGEELDNKPNGQPRQTHRSSHTNSEEIQVFSMLYYHNEADQDWDDIL